MNITASVVIPTYNRPQLAIKAAKIIRSFHSHIQITIVDQFGSSNIDLQQINDFNLKYINLNVENTSIAKNRGIKESDGKIVFFFDDDLEITKDTISEQLNAYTDPQVVATSGRVINDGDTIPKDTQVSTGRMNGLGTKFTQRFWSTKEQIIDFPYGCNMSFRKSTLNSVKGFDERLPKIFEEIDLGKRVSSHGVIKFMPKALAYHHKAPSGGTRQTKINHQKMLYRYYGYYLGKNITFPISILSLMLRTKTILTEAPFAVFNLYNGYIKGLLKILSSHATTAGSNRK